MPRIRLNRRALRDLVRLEKFLAEKNPGAAQRAIDAILQGLMRLEQFPALGRMVDDLPPEFREWIIEFGSGAYIARYHLDREEVLVVAIRHSREAGF